MFNKWVISVVVVFVFMQVAIQYVPVSYGYNVNTMKFWACFVALVYATLMVGILYGGLKDQGQHLSGLYARHIHVTERDREKEALLINLKVTGRIQLSQALKLLRELRADILDARSNLASAERSGISPDVEKAKWHLENTTTTYIRCVAALRSIGFTVPPSFDDYLLKPVKEPQLEP